MKKFLTAIAGLLIAFVSQAQEPVQWQYESKKIAAGTYEVHIKANIQDGWHVYAQEQPADGTAIPTKVTFNNNPLVSLSGKTKEAGEKQEQKVEVLGITQYHYEKQVEYVQLVKVKHDIKTNLTGNITFQVCTNKKCLPPENKTFSILL